MSGYIERFKRFVRYTHPYKWATLVAALGLTVALLFGLIYVVPKADAGSIQAGLTIIAEILGVILGAVLVVTVLLIEQSHQAEEPLRRLFPKYQSLIDIRIGTIKHARKQLVEQVRQGRVQLDEPAYVSPVSGPSSTKVRDLLAALSVLTTMFSNLREQVEGDLRELGYCDHDILYTLWVRWSSAAYDPEEFLRLVKKALDLRYLQRWTSDEFRQLATRVFKEYESDGLHAAVSRLERSRRFVRSRTFIAGVIVPTSTIVLATLMVFGTTSQTVSLSFYLCTVKLVLAGFTMSVILALLLVGKMLA